MAVLTFDSEDYRVLPDFLKDYASYVRAIKGNGPKTVLEYLMDLRTFFRYVEMKNRGCILSEDEFEKIDISSLTIEAAERVTTQRIIDFLFYIAEYRKNKNGTRMRKLSALKSFYHYAYSKRSLVSHDPTADIDAPKKGSTLPKYLTLEESVRLLEAIRNDKESKTVLRDYTIVTVFLNTGIRLSELVGLNLESLDPELRSMKVLGKGNKERIVYLNQGTRETLAKYIRSRLDPNFIRTSTPALFLSRRQTRISPKTVQWLVNKYLGLAGLGSKGLSVHKLRHTAATLMYQSGKVDIRVLKDILGHEQLNTTQIYTHVVSRNLEEAVESNPLSDIKYK